MSRKACRNAPMRAGSCRGYPVTYRRCTDSHRSGPGHRLTFLRMPGVNRQGQAHIVSTSSRSRTWFPIDPQPASISPTINISIIFICPLLVDHGRIICYPAIQNDSRTLRRVAYRRSDRLHVYLHRRGQSEHGVGCGRSGGVARATAAVAMSKRTQRP